MMERGKGEGREGPKPHPPKQNHQRTLRAFGRPQNSDCHCHHPHRRGLGRRIANRYRTNNCGFKFIYSDDCFR
jgi:hypothetical protein